MTHRVVSISDGKIRTKGDARDTVDSWVVSKEDVLAKAIQIGGKPIVIPSVGDYFILDTSKAERIGRYGQEYAFIKNALMAIRAWGYVLCILAIAGYLLLTARDMRR